MLQAHGIVNVKLPTQTSAIKKWHAFILQVLRRQKQLAVTSYMSLYETCSYTFNYY